MQNVPDDSSHVIKRVRMLNTIAHVALNAMNAFVSLAIICTIAASDMLPLATNHHRLGREICAFLINRYNFGDSTSVEAWSSIQHN